MKQGLQLPSLPPNLRSERQLIQLSARLTPGWEMLPEDGDEALVMGGLKQVHHLVNDHVFKEIFRLLDQLSIQANVASLVVTATPLGFHSLQVITSHLDLQLSPRGATQ